MMRPLVSVTGIGLKSISLRHRHFPRMYVPTPVQYRLKAKVLKFCARVQVGQWLEVKAGQWGWSWNSPGGGLKPERSSVLKKPGRPPTKRNCVNRGVSDDIAVVVRLGRCHGNVRATVRGAFAHFGIGVVGVGIVVEKVRPGRCFSAVIGLGFLSVAHEIKFTCQDLTQVITEADGWATRWDCIEAEGRRG